MIIDGKFSEILLNKKPRIPSVQKIADHKKQQNDFNASTHKLTDYRVYVDSGAHTLYNNNVLKKQGYNDAIKKGQDPFAFYDSQSFKDYLEGYIEFLHLHKHCLEFYVTLDVIKNPQRTWDVLKYMESCGLHPMPVYHYGEDISWYKKMIDNYEYVGIGGLGQEISKTRFFPFADKLFKMICNEDGTPRLKTHGFAVTSLEVLKQYPWHTTDSSTWTTLSRSGTVFIPKLNRQKAYDFLGIPVSVAVTEQRLKSKTHFNNLTPSVQKHILDYLGTLNLDLPKITEFFHFRDVANIRFFLQVEKELKVLYKQKFKYEQGGNILFAGTPAGSSSNISKFVRLLTDLDTESVGWLGTVYYPLILNNLLEIKRTFLSGKSPLQNKMHKPKKLTGLNNTSTTDKKVSIKTLKVRVKVEYEYEYVVNAAPYLNKSPEEIQKLEEAFVQKDFKKISRNPQNFNVQIET